MVTSAQGRKSYVCSGHILCPVLGSPPPRPQEGPGPASPSRHLHCPAAHLERTTWGHGWRSRAGLARGQLPGPGGPHLPPPSWLCPGSPLPLSRTVSKRCRSLRLEPEAKFTVCGIYKQPASRPLQKRLARTRAPRQGPASDLAPAGPAAGALLA